MWKNHMTRIISRAYIRNFLQLENHSLSLTLEKQITSFNYQCTIFTTETHGLQQYLYSQFVLTMEFWKMSRQI